VLRDLGSTNGTFVNGARVSEQILASADVIRLGKAGPEMVVSVEESSTGAIAPPRERATTGLVDSLREKLTSPTADPSDEANTRCVLAETYLSRGHHDDALEVLRPYQDPASFNALGEAERANVGLAMARVHTERKEGEQAVEVLQPVLEYAERTGDDLLLANAQAALGKALTHTGELLKARDVLHRAVLGARRAGNARLRAEVHLVLGRIDWKEGDLEGAHYQWKRAARLAEGTTDEILKARVALQEAFVLYASMPREISWTPLPRSKRWSSRSKRSATLACC
jgi:tetratricopeptide (TPR) repeat protein